MSVSDWCRNIDKTTILICVLFIIVVILLILNIQKANQLYVQSPSTTTPVMVKDVSGLIVPVTTPTVPQVEKFAGSNSNSNQPKLTLYYTEWCGYSQAILPEWQKLIDNIKSKNIFKNVVLEKIDCDKNKDQMCGKIPGFPTIVLDVNGDKKMFATKSNGAHYARTADGIMEFLVDCKLV